MGADNEIESDHILLAVIAASNVIAVGPVVGHYIVHADQFVGCGDILRLGCSFLKYTMPVWYAGHVL